MIRYTGVMVDPSVESAEVGDAELVVSFLNTLDQRTFAHRGLRHEPHDDLASAAGLGRWLGEQGLVERPRVADADLADALALRAALRDSLLAAHEGEAGTRAAAAPFIGFPLRLAADRSGALSLSCDPPRSGAVGQALAALVTTVATAAVRGEWDRVRLCAAPECRWAFFDGSRRGDKRWCSTAVCGNRHKTAEYRARANRTGPAFADTSSDR
jgi:predicted RNA-binding Zn ribbon-like protein